MSEEDNVPAYDDDEMPPIGPTLTRESKVRNGLEVSNDTLPLYVPPEDLLDSNTKSGGCEINLTFILYVLVILLLLYVIYDYVNHPVCLSR
jgi:hypothetical protein